MSVLGTRQFNDTLLADVHFWNYQGREVLVYSMIDEATRFPTQILPSQPARDLYESDHDCLGEMGRSSTFSVG